MEIQIWTADMVPPYVPEFVSSHITPDIDIETGKEYYILAIDHNHDSFKNFKNKINQRRAARVIMLKLGFINPRYIGDDEMPSSDWDCPCHSENN